MQAKGDHIMEMGRLGGSPNETVTLGTDIERSLKKLLEAKTNPTLAYAEDIVDRLFVHRRYKKRITDTFGYSGITAEIKQDSKDWAKREVRRIVKARQKELTRSKQSLNISKKKGSKGKIDGITDLAPDLADMITKSLRKTKVPDDVLHRIDQEQAFLKKKKKSKKKKNASKKTKQRRRRR